MTDGNGGGRSDPAAPRPSGALPRLMGRDLRRLAVPALFLGGLSAGRHHLAVAIGVDEEGRSHPLAVSPGSPGDPAAAETLLRGLLDRGLDVSAGICVVTDREGAFLAARSTLGPRAVLRWCGSTPLPGAGTDPDDPPAPALPTLPSTLERSLWSMASPERLIGAARRLMEADPAPRSTAQAQRRLAAGLEGAAGGAPRMVGYRDLPALSAALRSLGAAGRPPAPATDAAAGRPRVLRRRLVAAMAAILVLVGFVLGIGAESVLRPPGPTALGPAGTRLVGEERSLPTGFAPVADAARAVKAERGVPPVEVAIPVIGVRSRLVGLRLNPDRTLQVPTDYAVAGWYRDGPAPGDRGSPAVVVGHVDSTNGPAVFFRLRELRTGDAVFVRRADGTTVRFEVYRNAEYDKSAFPARSVYAPTARPEIRLITCTGVFDRGTGHYLSNLVVFAREAAPVVTRTPAAGATAMRKP